MTEKIPVYSCLCLLPLSWIGQKNFLLMLSAGKWPGGDGNDKIKSEQIYVVNSNFNSVSFFMKKYEEKIFLRFEIFIIYIDICIHMLYSMYFLFLTIKGNTNITINKKYLNVDHIRQACRDFTCLVRYSY